ncbi:MAG: flagellar protein FliT [Betaproteobacteria bacterium]
MKAFKTSQCALLACYESLQRISLCMLEAARDSDWQALGLGEHACERLFESIAALGHPHTILDEDGRRQRMQILSTVLAIDARIRNLINPWLRDVERYVGLPRTAQPLASPS